MTPLHTGRIAWRKNHRHPQRALILIVDDEPSILVLLDELLTDEGFTVDRATNGRDALEHALSAPPDLVVTDLMMPVMDGRTLVRQLRQQPRTATIPVLLLSAAYHQQPNDVFTAVLPKPFNSDALFEAIYTLLG